MLTKNYLIVFKSLLLMIVMSVFVTACNKASEDTEVKEVEISVPTLSDKNIREFSAKMAKDYNNNLNSLMDGYNQAKKVDNAYAFMSYRNNKWTPIYIKQKDYYQKVFEQNKSYLSHSASKPLFEKFEGLIYIGIDLKNAFLDEDKAKLQEVLAVINEDKKIVKSIVK